MKNIFCLFLSLSVFVGTTGCGKSNDGAQATSQGIAAQPQPNPQPFPVTGGSWPQIQGWGAYYFVNYQFWENGCQTGLKRFSGPNPEDVRRQLCEGLQNEWMNNRCAQSMRASYFSNMCSGYSWSPRP